MRTIKNARRRRRPLQMRGPEQRGWRGEMEFRVRRAVMGDEGVLRALRIEALTEAPEAFGSTLERELARTTEDWRRWMALG